MMYRYVFFLACILSSVYGKPQGAHVYDAETDCFTQHPSIDRDFLESLKRAKKLPDNPTTDFKCFIACVGKSLNLMSTDGDLNHHELKKVTVAITAGDVSHDDAHEMVSKCVLDAVHEDDCEKAYQYVECKIVELLPYAFAGDFCPSCTA